MKSTKDVKNAAIRDALIDAGIRHWELACMMGISENTLCRRLRKELSVEEKEKILSVIKGYKTGRAV